MEYRTQKILLTGNIDDESHSFLLWCCEHSQKLYNCTLFLIRQAHFANCPRHFFFDQNDLYRNCFKLTRVKASYAQLCKDLKNNPHYQAIGGSQGQQTIKSVLEAIRGYNSDLAPESKPFGEGNYESEGRRPKVARHEAICEARSNLRGTKQSELCGVKKKNE